MSPQPRTGGSFRTREKHRERGTAASRGASRLLAFDAALPGASGASALAPVESMVSGAPVKPKNRHGARFVDSPCRNSPGLLRLSSRARRKLQSTRQQRVERHGGMVAWAFDSPGLHEDLGAAKLVRPEVNIGWKAPFFQIPLSRRLLSH